MQRKYVLVFDVEASGGNTAAHFMTQFAAVMYDGWTGVELGFYTSYVMKPGHKKWEVQCVEEFWKRPTMIDKYKTTLQEITRRVYDPVHVMRGFVNWINAFPDIHYSVVAPMADTAGFDYAFMDINMPDGIPFSKLVRGPLTGEHTRYIKTIDLTSYYAGLLRIDPSEYIDPRDAAYRLTGRPVISRHVHDHDPLNDARSIADTYFHICPPLHLVLQVDPPGPLPDVSLGATVPPDVLQQLLPSDGSSSEHPRSIDIDTMIQHR